MVGCVHNFDDSMTHQTANMKKPGGKKRDRGGGEKKEGVGNGILSHTVTSAVPSALVSLTAGFGMGPGVPSRL